MRRLDISPDGQVVADVHHHPVVQTEPDESWLLHSGEGFGRELWRQEGNNQDGILDVDVGLLAVVRPAVVNIGLDTTRGTRTNLQLRHGVQNWAAHFLQSSFGQEDRRRLCLLLSHVETPFVHRCELYTW